MKVRVAWRLGKAGLSLYISVKLWYDVSGDWFQFWEGSKAFGKFGDKNYVSWTRWKMVLYLKPDFNWIYHQNSIFIVRFCIFNGDGIVSLDLIWICVIQQDNVIEKWSFEILVFQFLISVPSVAATASDRRGKILVRWYLAHGPTSRNSETQRLAFL